MTPLATTIEGLRAQAEEFLAKNGFPVNPRYLQMFGSFVQMSGEDVIYLNEEGAINHIKKAEINEAAFFLINPSAYKKLKELEAQDANAEQQAEITPKEVVPTP